MSTPSDAVGAVDLLLARAEAAPGRALFSVHGDGGPRRVTAAEFLAQVRWLARGLVAAGLGPGERVAVLSPATFEAHLAGTAVWYAGGVTVPIDASEAPAHVEAILAESGATRVFAARELAGSLSAMLGASAVLGDRLIPVTLLAVEGDGGTLTSLAGPGQGVSDAELERHRAAVHRDSPAVILARPESWAGDPPPLASPQMTVTHGALARLAAPLVSVLAARTAEPRAVVALPLSHPHASAAGVACLAAGASLAVPGDAALPAADPTFVLGSPRLFEELFEGAARSGGPRRRGRFARAAAIARAHSEADDGGASPGGGPRGRLRLAHAMWERLAYRRLRESMIGASLETAAYSGGTLDPDLAHFFRGIGVPIVGIESIVDDGALGS
ncbi:AMP-binding protein [Sinomonas sp. JGH33]|uniref:AMP-binding protein n=1 Tax=Sinomonas terricola TaxID=3110330 RepID=A0ABU5T9Q8_9MICC|nr:AMP-binding protein [Sinomonas sp. JGH33]MEA5456191.1 AMP-binding protein [Sinomonas sp. JGH33]